MKYNILGSLCVLIANQKINIHQIEKYSPSLHQKLALYSKMQDSQEASGNGGGGRLGPPPHPIKEEEDKELAPGAEYLSSRCVLFTYFQGDISAVVDEHFSRALSHTAVVAYPPSSSHKAVRGVCVRVCAIERVSILLWMPKEEKQ